MNTVFSMVMNGVERGQKLKINLKEKTLALNRHTIIDKGVCLVDMELIDANDFNNLGVNGINEFYEVEELYKRYKHSVPSEKSNNNRPYFKALSYEELSDRDMICGLRRDIAQAMLETYILVMSMKGWLTWKNDKHWFYQSNTDRDFVLLREYI